MLSLSTRGAQASGSAVTTEELQGDDGAAPVFEIDVCRDASRGIGSDRTDESVGSERREAVQASGQISGDRGRTSVSESEASNKGSRDILRAKLKVVWAKVESNRERARSATATNLAN